MQPRWQSVSEVTTRIRALFIKLGLHKSRLNSGALHIAYLIDIFGFLQHSYTITKIVTCARKLPLGRCRLLEKIKICGREVGRWREGERVRTIGTILDKEESVSRFSSPVLEERMERKTLTSSNMNGPRSQEDGKKCGSSFDHQPRRRAREKERQIPMLVWRFKNRLCHRGMQI